MDEAFIKLLELSGTDAAKMRGRGKVTIVKRPDEGKPEHIAKPEKPEKPLEGRKRSLPPELEILLAIRTNRKTMKPRIRKVGLLRGMLLRTRIKLRGVVVRTRVKLKMLLLRARVRRKRLMKKLLK